MCTCGYLFLLSTAEWFHTYVAYAGGVGSSGDVAPHDVDGAQVLFINTFVLGYTSLLIDEEALLAFGAYCFAWAYRAWLHQIMSRSKSLILNARCRLL